MRNFNKLRNKGENNPQPSILMKLGAVAAFTASLLASAVGCASGPNTDPSEGPVWNASTLSVDFCADAGEPLGVVAVDVTGDDFTINTLSHKCDGKDPAPVGSNEEGLCVEVPRGTTVGGKEVESALLFTSDNTKDNGRFDPMTARSAFILLSDQPCK